MSTSLLRRLADKGRREGPRGLLLGSLGRTMYRHVVLSEADFREDIPVPRCDPPIEVRRLRREEVAAYARSRPKSPEELIQRMERGSECYAAWHAGEIVSAAWWHPGEAWMEELDRRFLLRRDETYAYDGWTVPRLRGHNITPARAVLTMRMLREQGVRGAVMFSLPENRSIRRAWKKMGWRPFGVAGFLRMGPIRLEFVRVRGHTRWRLRRRRPASARSQPPPAEPDLLDESAREVADRRTAAA